MSLEQIFRNRSILTHLSITKYCRKYVRAFILSSKPLDQLCYYVDRLVFLINCSTLINMVHKLWALEFFTVERTWRFLSRLKPPNYPWQNTLVTGHIKMYFWFILYVFFKTEWNIRKTYDNDLVRYPLYFEHFDTYLQATQIREWPVPGVFNQLCTSKKLFASIHNEFM